MYDKRMIRDFLDDLSGWERALLVLVVALAAHILVLVVRWGNRRAIAGLKDVHISKTRTVLSLLSSLLIFSLYFGAVGFALIEMGIPLTTYLAGASIIGLAVAFGSQGLVQDVVSGLTMVFSNLFDIGDVVEIGGQVGVVNSLGMRFTVLRSPMGSLVYVPNRNVTNVITYPRGYVRCLVDVVLDPDEEIKTQIEETVRKQVAAAQEQYSGVFRAPAEISGPIVTRSGKKYLRIKFRIWPGRGGPLEGAFCQEMRQAIKKIQPDYADWMVSASYEVEPYSPPRWRK